MELAEFRFVNATDRGTIDGACMMRSFLRDFDVFLGAAVSDSDHGAQADGDDDSNQRPRSADARQDTQLPERGQDAADQDDEANQVHACPFHY